MWRSFRPERVCVCVIVSMFGVRITECQDKSQSLSPAAILFLLTHLD